MDFRTSLVPYFPEKDIDSLLASIDHGTRSHALLLNTKKMSDEEFLRRYPDVQKHPYVPHAYLYDPSIHDFGKNILYDNGVFSIQDAAAMMVTYFLKPEEDDVVLDMCAAPGGKAIGASLHMNDKGVVIANDISYPRAKNMSQNIERMGRGNIICASNDFIFSYVHFQDTFDKIIVDAPCSGSMMFRKDEKARADWDYKKVKSNARKQIELLGLAYKMLKPGGTLAYSTCSFSYEEDIGTIKTFLLKSPEAIPVKLEDDPSFYHHPDLPEAVFLWPDRFVGEGQFIALLRKPGTLEKTPKKVVQNLKYERFLSDYGLEERSNEIMRGKFYSLYQSFDVSHLNILRYGVKLFEMRDIFIPDHHLAHFLTPNYSLPVSFHDAQAYIAGETFETNQPDGFHLISYDHQNLGFIKAVNGIAKNHYPKGLRRKWDPAFDR